MYRKAWLWIVQNDCNMVSQQMWLLLDLLKKFHMFEPHPQIVVWWKLHRWLWCLSLLRMCYSVENLQLVWSICQVSLNFFLAVYYFSYFEEKFSHLALNNTVKQLIFFTVLGIVCKNIHYQVGAYIYIHTHTHIYIHIYIYLNI